MLFECKYEKDFEGTGRDVFYFTSPTFSCYTDYPLNQCSVSDWEAVAEGVDGSNAASDVLTVTIKGDMVRFELHGGACSGCIGDMWITLPFSECKNALADAAAAAAYIDDVEA